MDKKDSVPEFKPLSNDEQRVAAKKWTFTKVMMFIVGVAAMLGGIYMSIYNIGDLIKIMLLIGGGLLIGKARSVF